jgi:hypothetical protein
MLTFDDPRPSIFADWRICVPMSAAGARPAPGASAPDPALRCAGSRADAVAADYRDFDPDAVLAYTLVGGQQTLGTVRAWLAQQDWYNSAIADLGAAAKRADAASGLCRRIRSAVAELGLSTTDQHITVWSVINGMPLAGDAVTALKQSPDCKTSLDPIDKARATP